MKTVRATLLSAIMLALGLPSAVALGAERDIADYGPSTKGFSPESGVLKFQDDCPDETAFFKNVVPGLTNGSVAGSTVPPIEFIIDGKTVTMSISWDADNSFGFNITGGLAHIVAVTSDTNNLLYDYVNHYPAVNNVEPGTVIGPVFADGNLNDIQDAADVNHLDLCLAPVDTTPPSIVFIEPLNGDTVAGSTVTVRVEVTDDSGVDPDSVTISVNGETLGFMSCGTTQPPLECSYLWNTAGLLGPYTITVTATDQAVTNPDGPNTGTASVDIEVIDLTSCFGTLGEEDFDPDPTEPLYAGGCNPTGKVLLQAPPDTETCAGDNPPNTCFLMGTLLKPDPARVSALYDAGDCPAGKPDYCGSGFPDCRMAEDATGSWYPKYKENLYVFDSQQQRGVGIHPDLAAGVLAAVQASYPPGSTPPQDLNNALVLDDTTYCANGCCSIAQHVKGYKETASGVEGTQPSVLYPEWPVAPPTGLAFIKTHFPGLVVPLGQLAKCYDEDTNRDLQNAAGAGYAPLFQSPDDTGFVTVLTQRCKNPARDLTRNNGLDVSNIIVSTAGLDYIDVETAPIEVLTFMYQQSEADFARLFFILDVVERDALLDTGNFRRDVRSPVNQAKRRFDNFNTTSLQQSIDALADAADGIRTKTTYLVVEANPPGEALALIEHLIWDLGLLKRELIRVEALP